MSAWARLESAEMHPDGLRQVATAIVERRLVASLPFLPEAGYSARSGNDHDRLMTQLGALPSAAVDAEAEECAKRAQSELARSGHHRIPPVDLLVAAIAHTRRDGVLHCDRHYDLIADKTSLDFPSVWLVGSRAPR